MTNLITLLLEERNTREGMVTDVADCDLGLGIACSERGNYPRALEFFESGKFAFEAKGAERDVTLCQLETGLVFMKIGDYDNAKARFRVARSMFLDQGDLEGMAQCEINLGSIHLKRGDLSKALECHQSAKRIFSETCLNVEEAVCDLILGDLYWGVGQYHKVLESFESAERTFLDAGVKDDLGWCRLSKGIVLEILGQEDRATRAIESAKEIFVENEMKRAEAVADLLLGHAYGEVAEYSQSVAFLTSAKRIFEKSDMHFWVALCNIFLSDIYYDLDKNDEAMKLLDSSWKVLSDLDVRPILDFGKTSIGRLNEDPVAVLKLLETSRRESTSLNERGELEVSRLSLLGAAYEMLGHYKEAAALKTEAVDLLESIRASFHDTRLKGSFLDSRAPVYYDMISTCLYRGQFARAIECAERLKSRNLAEMLANRDLSARSAPPEERMEFQRLRFQMRALANRISKKSDFERAGALQEEIKSCERDHREILARIKIKEPSFDPDQQLNLSYDMMRELVTNDTTAIVVLLPLHDCTVAFVISSRKAPEPEALIVDDYDKSCLASDIIELAKRYDAWREGVAPSRSWLSGGLSTLWSSSKSTVQGLAALVRRIASSDRQPTPSGIESIRNDPKDYWEDFLDDVLRVLYAKIFSRLRPLLKGIDRIVFVSYGAFHWLPLHAMFTETSAGRRYVIDDYQVSYAPSMKLLYYCRNLERQHKRTVGVFRTNTGADSRDLAYSADEVDSLMRLFDDCDLYARATKLDLLNHAGRANILHYSGHADMESLLLHAETNPLEVDKYSTDDIFASLDLPQAYLATLSGCETGMAELQRFADEYRGLPSAFLHAGAANVISSLWKVSDVSTSLLMKKMYELIRRGSGASRALNEAQRWLKDCNNRHEHLEYLPEWCKDSRGTDGRKVVSGTRFRPGPIDPELILPEDLSKPYHWAGWICSGAD